MKPKTIEINEQFKKALDVIENTSKNVFVTGKAGTGKSTLLEYFRSKTKKKIAVLAPTGVAALNVRGETIHSFFRFKPNITLEKIKKIKGKRARIFKEIEAIVIDEISMVRADLLDCIERFLRLNGKNSGMLFGGIQMIFIGDLYQLPPVVTLREKHIFSQYYQSPYFFSARLFEELEMEFIELEKIYRQKDEDFIGLLNAIRNNSITDEMLEMLNTRAQPCMDDRREAFTLHLTTTNQMAARINNYHLQQLRSKIFTYQAEMSGDFQEHTCPADAQLQVAVGAQVMLLNNDSEDRWVNGSIAEVKEIKHDKKNDTDVIYVRMQDGSLEEVLPHSWELFHYRFNEDTFSIETESAGSFTQYPLKLAWAITIHKSQGKTFERVVIDMGNGAFANGQTYVALSRCTSLDGIILKRSIRKSDIRMDWNIAEFLTKYQYALSQRDLPLEDKVDLIEQAIKNDCHLAIVYLKASDEKTRRVIKPLGVGKKEYRGETFIGVDAYCLKRGEERVFRVDWMLEIKLADVPH
ncbi:MAG: AAA family ATPase [Candidatus Omnitrophota bacterium]|jgi:ATP-dependent exoDNAse (exonuclease V) alpha subunit